MNNPRSLGRCKSCKKAHRAEGAGFKPSVTCDCGTRVRLEPVIGFTAPKVHCGALCRNAVGPSCDCSCGGANHGPWALAR
jgi:hypothetical protein